jgi:hypothetical protein
VVPPSLVPLWDAHLAAHDPDGFRGPFFDACSEAGATVNMPTGSSSKLPCTSAYAPAAVSSTLTDTSGTFSMVDFLYVPKPTSAQLRDHNCGSFLEPAHGLRSVDESGEDNTTYESDDPHSDLTCPRTREITKKQMAGPTEDQRCRTIRGNAMWHFHLDACRPDRRSAAGTGTGTGRNVFRRVAHPASASSVHRTVVGFE